MGKNVPKALPSGFLSRKGKAWRPIRILDLAILLYNVYTAAQKESIGFEDARETLDTFTSKLNKTVFIDPDLIESGLWACNLLDERKAFKHVKDKSFNEFVKDLVPNGSFDTFYNIVKWNNEKPSKEEKTNA